MNLTSISFSTTNRDYSLVVSGLPASDISYIFERAPFIENLIIQSITISEAITLADSAIVLDFSCLPALWNSGFHSLMAPCSEVRSLIMRLVVKHIEKDYLG
ncbi:hypothetical protein [Dipodfec virus UOA04_Rod_391]|nr:hypothetical protein [Dipodfec virus UOA04_Rod_391]